MGLSLKKIGRVATGVATGGLSEVFRAMQPGKVSAPGLPPTPTLNEYGAMPDFSPQELAYLQQQQQLMDQYRAALAQDPSAFQRQGEEIGLAENRNYLEALNAASGQLTMAQKQQQKKDFEKLVAAAGARGIRILGDDPTSATSDSTAGNQILSDFNQRYQVAADQNRMAQIQMGGGQNLARMGFNQNAQSANLANILNGQTAYSNMMSPYQQQRLGAYGIQNANVDIRNQGLLNNYQSAYNQQMLNYQANAQNQANKMGFINSMMGLGGTIGGALIAGPGGAAVGGTAGRALGPQASQPIQTPMMGMSPYQNSSMGWSGNRLSLY